MYLSHQGGELAYYLRMVIQILDDLVHLTGFRQANKHMPHLRFGLPDRDSNIAYPWRIEIPFQ
ncbi:hypothetical protein D3C84_1223450 [compost metagenome]